MKNYLTGKHLTFLQATFKSIPPEKQKIINNLLDLFKKAKESKDTDGISLSPFSLYKAFTIARIDNFTLSREKGGSPGKCAKILSTYLPIMLKLTLDRPIGSDEWLFKELNLKKAEKDRLELLSRSTTTSSTSATLSMR